MKRSILLVAMTLLVAAGGCARLRRNSGSVVLPSGARMPPTTVPVPALTPVAQPSPAPATAPAPVAQTVPAPAPAPVVQPVPAPPPAPAVQPTPVPAPSVRPAPTPTPGTTPPTPIVSAPIPPPVPAPALPVRVAPPHATSTMTVQAAAVPAPPPVKKSGFAFWKKEPPEAPRAPAAPKPPRVYRMKSGDPIVIVLRGIPGYVGGQQSIEGILDENGAITLPLLNVVQAAGKTPSELEHEIRDRYINEGYYRDLGVNIVIPSQSYFVRGEVRGPGRFPVTGGVTILQALATAGGFTEFANSRRVELLRGDERIVVNVRDIEKHPARDRELEAGDVIIVPRSPF